MGNFKNAGKRLKVAAGFCLLLGHGLLIGACSNGGSAASVGVVSSGQPAISVSVPSLEFGDQVVGSFSLPQSVSATNTGNAALTISSIGVSPAQFLLLSGPPLLSLNPGDSVSFSLAFAPDSAQAYGGSLTLSSDAPTSPTAIALSGNGTNASTPIVSTTSLPAATASANYLAFLQASGGSGPMVWSQSGLPPPLILDAATGIISGVAPATTGLHSLTVQVTDSNAPPQFASQALNLTVKAATGGNCDNIFIDVGDISPLPDSAGPHVTPLNDLGADSYLGESGGLYPNGGNAIPAEHLSAGVNLADALQPLDANGNPDPAIGKMVLISIGMSNTSMEFSEFITDLAGDAAIHPQLLIVNGAQAGFDAPTLLNPNGTFWKNIRNVILPAAGATAKQVVAAWVKEADANPSGSFPASAQVLQADLEVIAQNLKINFPQIRLAYFSSRIYAGYATVPLSPEPSAYEGGFAVKWAIQDQIEEIALNFDPSKGAVVAPWIAWGPYLWANGLIPRSDGLVWTCQDLQPDGTHPSMLGREKVSQALIQFFKTDPTTTPWFLKQ